MTQTRQWLLNGHPRGRRISDDDLKLVTVDLPEAGAGQMLLKTLYLGFDPAQKGWMENIADYVAPMAIGDVMRGSGNHRGSKEQWWEICRRGHYSPGRPDGASMSFITVPN